MKKRAKRWLWRLTALVLVLLAGAGAVWWARSRAISLEDYLLQIDQLSQGEDPQQALNLCDQALEDYPQEGTLYEKKARLYWSAEEADLAVRTLDYGYKQTGWESLKTLRDQYDTTQEEDVSFEEVRLNASQAQQQETVEDYVPYTLPEIQLPQVERVSGGEESASEAE